MSDPDDDLTPPHGIPRPEVPDEDHAPPHGIPRPYPVNRRNAKFDMGLLDSKRYVNPYTHYGTNTGNNSTGSNYNLND